MYGNYATDKRLRFLKQLLAFSGLEEGRLRSKWISSAEGPEFASEMREFIENLKTLGPSRLRKARSEKIAA
ncbi:MAG: hydrogenase iron-sulfur subunit [Desulfobacteraceae bacterium]|nr:hydrogenase iron-sulfur subunit [Desulfobacteraceae bacterium]